MFLMRIGEEGYHFKFKEQNSLKQQEYIYKNYPIYKEISEK